LIAMSGRRTRSRLDATTCTPRSATERGSAACAVSRNAASSETASSDIDAFAAWFPLIDALAEDAARRLWEQGAPAAAPRPVPTPQAPSRRKGRRS
jgi:hypothetical protein